MGGIQPITALFSFAVYASGQPVQMVLFFFTALDVVGLLGVGLGVLMPVSACVPLRRLDRSVPRPVMCPVSSW